MAIRILPLLLLAVAAGCNSSLSGQTAPALPQAGWLDDAAPQTDGKWVLVEFFSPG